MSGIAIVIKGADFSKKNIGKVTLLQDVDVTGIKIIANSSYEGVKAQLSVTYEPSNTNQNVCTWQVVQGSEYAEIDVMTGLLHILEGAENADVTVRATSVYNSDIYAEATIRVTYRETVETLDDISDIVMTAIDTNVYKLSAVFDPENTAYTGVAWSLVSGSAYASLDSDSGELTVLEAAETAQNIVIRATSTYNVEITKEKSISVQWKKAPSWDFSKIVASIDMSEGLGQALCENKVTMLVEFSDDSTYQRLSEFSQTVIGTQMGATDEGAFKNYIGGGLVFMCERNNGLSASINGLYGLNYNTSSKMSVPVNRRYTGSQPIGSSPTVQPSSIFIMNNDSLIANGNTSEMTNAESTVRQGFMQYMTFGFALDYGKSYDAGMTCEELYISQKELWPNNKEGGTDMVKTVKLIVLPGTYSTVDDILAARDTALIDIRFDVEGMPYNAGSGGELSLYKLS